jgi:hypothetical protein
MIEPRRALSREHPRIRILAVLPRHHSRKHVNDGGAPPPPGQCPRDGGRILGLRQHVHIPGQAVDGGADVVRSWRAHDRRQRHIRDDDDEAVAGEVRAVSGVDEGAAGEEHAAGIHPGRFVGHPRECGG